MTAQELFDSIQNLEILIYKINKREQPAIKELNRLHRIAFGEPVTVSCSNCHIKAYRKLLSLTLKELETMENQNFKIKKSALIEYPARSGQFYSASKGIEDKVAIEYLKQFPQLIKNFETYPGSESESKELDLSSFEKVEEPIKEKPLDRMNKTELQSKYKEVIGEDADADLDKKDLIIAIKGKE